MPKRDAAALARRILELMTDPVLRARIASAGRATARDYDIAAFVRKMERLYDLLHAKSRATGRRVVETEDLSFLATPTRAARIAAPKGGARE